MAFLRAVNLGARRRFPAADQAAVTAAAGFRGVATYLATGNVRVEAATTDPREVQRRLEQAYAADRGFDVPVVVLPAAELRAVVAAGVEVEAARSVPPGRHHVSLLQEEPDPAAQAELVAAAAEGEQVVVRGRAVHLLIGESYHLARVDGARVERLLGVSTNRTFAVLTTLAQRWCPEPPAG
ncbi:DUF1697 domain-containing protein [Nocardioides perillae]|uniref:Uncharacterized protein (DUF1697 family) n=1 Tax=Nocardioides perillae TaxID=1119534 RepID=A0A7Y9RU05_9ACTN|nr:uncharacterized protein (DUF1697 family) [Nocardioides perillae]